MTTRKSQISAYVMSEDNCEARHERVSGVDLMSDNFSSNLHRRAGRFWAEGIRSLRQIRSQIVAANG